MTEFWLIRHGQTPANIGQRVQDAGSYGLTKAGEHQADWLAEIWWFRPDLIITSPYLRTKLTAQPLQNRFPDVPHEEWQVQEYSPYATHFYDPELTRKQMRALRDQYRQRRDPHYVTGENAESFVNLLRRAQNFLERIQDREEKRILIFSHATFTRAVYWVWLHGGVDMSTRTMERFFSFRHPFPIPNTSYVHGKVMNGRIYLSSPITDHLEEWR